MTTQFKPGDVVALPASIENVMTLLELAEEGETADCAWFSEGKLELARFPVAALSKPGAMERNAAAEVSTAQASAAAFEALQEVTRLRGQLSSLHNAVERALAATRAAYPEFDPHEGIEAAVKTLALRYTTVRDEGNEIIGRLQQKLREAGLD